MINNFISMNGYGLYVWLSFSIAIIACAVVYYKTYKTLKKYEKEFAKELEKLSVHQKKIVLKESKIASQVLASYNRSI